MDNDGELVFAAPSYVGEIAERARRVEELEQIIIKKDELLKKIAHIERKSMLADCAYQGPPPKKWVRETAPRYEGYNECLQQVQSFAKDALSLTPDSVAQSVEDARVGRAVREWQQRKDAEWRGKQKCSGLDHYVDAYIEALGELEKVIAKAREATPHA